jgi:hypothetical protein
MRRAGQLRRSGSDDADGPRIDFLDERCQRGKLGFPADYRWRGIRILVGPPEA